MPTLGFASAKVSSRVATYSVAAASLCFAVIAALGLGWVWTLDPLLALSNWLACVTFAATAGLLWNEPGQFRNGWLFLGVALCWMAGYLGASLDVGPFPVVQWLVGPLVFPVLALLLLRYPEPQI